MAMRLKSMATLPKLIQSMRKEVPKHSNPVLPSLRRAFSLYDQINLIDNVPEDQLRFQE
jgi:NADH dehydrogenase [ubiquinone] 1 alpha subcomplex assembly factor 3